MKRVVRGKYVPIEDTSLSWSELQQNIIRRHIFYQCGWHISESSAVIRMYGLGAAGRIKPNSFTIIEVYTPWNCKTYSLRLSYLQLRYLLLPEHPDLFKPGMKLALLKKLCTMLYFEYKVLTFPPLPEDFYNMPFEQRDFMRAHHPEKFEPAVQIVQHLDPITMPRFYPQTIIEIIEGYNDTNNHTMKMLAPVSAHGQNHHHDHEDAFDNDSVADAAIDGYNSYASGDGADAAIDGYNSNASGDGADAAIDGYNSNASGDGIGIDGALLDGDLSIATMEEELTGLDADLKTDGVDESAHLGNGHGHSSAEALLDEDGIGALLDDDLSIATMEEELDVLDVGLAVDAVDEDAHHQPQTRSPDGPDGGISNEKEVSVCASSNPTNAPIATATPPESTPISAAVEGIPVKPEDPTLTPTKESPRSTSAMPAAGESPPVTADAELDVFLEDGEGSKSARSSKSSGRDPSSARSSVEIETDASVRGIIPTPILLQRIKISRLVRTNGADLRYKNDVIRKAQEEAERAAVRAAWLAIPLRKRGLVTARAYRNCGRYFIFSVYKFPTKPMILRIKTHVSICCGSLQHGVPLPMVGPVFKYMTPCKLWTDKEVKTVCGKMTRAMTITAEDRKAGGGYYSVFGNSKGVLAMEKSEESKLKAMKPSWEMNTLRLRGLAKTVHVTARDDQLETGEYNELSHSHRSSSALGLRSIRSHRSLQVGIPTPARELHKGTKLCCRGVKLKGMNARCIFEMYTPTAVSFLAPNAHRHPWQYPVVPPDPPKEKKYDSDGESEEEEELTEDEIMAISDAKKLVQEENDSECNRIFDALIPEFQLRMDIYFPGEVELNADMSDSKGRKVTLYVPAASSLSATFNKDDIHCRISNKNDFLVGMQCMYRSFFDSASAEDVAKVEAAWVNIGLDLMHRCRLYARPSTAAGRAALEPKPVQESVPEAAPMLSTVPSFPSMKAGIFTSAPSRSSPSSPRLKSRGSSHSSLGFQELNVDPGSESPHSVLSPPAAGASTTDTASLDGLDASPVNDNADTASLDGLDASPVNDNANDPDYHSDSDSEFNFVEEEAHVVEDSKYLFGCKSEAEEEKLIKKMAINPKTFPADSSTLEGLRRLSYLTFEQQLELAENYLSHEADSSIPCYQVVKPDQMGVSISASDSSTTNVHTVSVAASEPKPSLGPISTLDPISNSISELENTSNSIPTDTVSSSFSAPVILETQPEVDSTACEVNGSSPTQSEAEKVPGNGPEKGPENGPEKEPETVPEKEPEFEYEATLRWPACIFKRNVKINSEAGDRVDVTVPVAMWQKGNEVGVIAYDRGAPIAAPVDEEEMEGEPVIAVESAGGSRPLTAASGPETSSVGVASYPGSERSSRPTTAGALSDEDKRPTSASDTAGSDSAPGGLIESDSAQNPRPATSGSGSLSETGVGVDVDVGVDLIPPEASDEVSDTPNEGPQVTGSDSDNGNVNVNSSMIPIGNVRNGAICRAPNRIYFVRSSKSVMEEQIKSFRWLPPLEKGAMMWVFLSLELTYYNTHALVSYM